MAELSVVRAPVSARALLVPGAIAVVLGIVLGLVVEAHDGAGPLSIDVAWAALAGRVREVQPWLLEAARVLNVLGGGWFGVVGLPLLVAGGLLLARRARAAVVFLVASAASALVVQLLKWLFDRERPAEMLVTSDAGSFPSGHTANAATIAVLACALLRRWWVGVLATLYVLAQAVSRSLLGVHWLTDLVAGVLVGAGVGLVVLGVAGVLARAGGAGGNDEHFPGSSPSTTA